MNGNDISEIANLLDDIHSIIAENFENNSTAAIQDVFQYIEYLEKLNEDQPTNITRSKRETTSTNCTEILNRISEVEDNISLTQIRIQNSTVTLNTLNNQVATYEARVESSTGSTLITNQNLLNIYRRLQAATVNTIANLNNQLTALQDELEQLQADYDTYCVFTTTTLPPVYPCGKSKSNYVNIIYDF